MDIYLSEYKKHIQVFTCSLRTLLYIISKSNTACKIPNIIKAVLKCFLPNLDVRLPKENCAEYMHKEELKTVSMAHKASTLDNLVEGVCFI